MKLKLHYDLETIRISRRQLICAVEYCRTRGDSDLGFLEAPAAWLDGIGLDRLDGCVFLAEVLNDAARTRADVTYMWGDHVLSVVQDGF